MMLLLIPFPIPRFTPIPCSVSSSTTFVCFLPLRSIIPGPIPTKPIFHPRYDYIVPRQLGTYRCIDAQNSRTLPLRIEFCTVLGPCKPCFSGEDSSPIRTNISYIKNAGESSGGLGQGPGQPLYTTCCTAQSVAASVALPVVLCHRWWGRVTEREDDRDGAIQNIV